MVTNKKNNKKYAFRTLRKRRRMDS